LTNVILSSEQVADLVERMLRLSGRRLDLSTPFVDAQLPDGPAVAVLTLHNQLNPVAATGQLGARGHLVNLGRDGIY
jgi:Flp pilus assembly CpaF family ATPase